jgi:hypothetical protein
MSNNEMTRLSASRIKTAQSCSWTYWCKYKLKLPDTSNDGASRGTICHLILELLCDPRRKSYYDKIIAENTMFCVASVERLVKIWARRLGVDDPDNIDLIDTMTINGLQYDYFGNATGKLEEAFSEKDFHIIVEKEDIKYRINGFIDKLFLYKKEKIAIIRDFKTSKEVFQGKEAKDNLQDLIYSLAVKHLYPDYSTRQSEFLFLKFDLNKDLLGADGKGVLKMAPLSDEELEGFEYQLTEWQNYLDNFDEETARSDFAFDKGFPPKEDGFCGRLSCGFAKHPGQLKKDGNPMWHCSFKFGFDYWVLKNSDGIIKKSAHIDQKDSLIEIQDDSDTITKESYSGCPVHNQPSTKEFDDEFSL